MSLPTSTSNHAHQPSTQAKSFNKLETPRVPAGRTGVKDETGNNGRPSFPVDAIEEQAKASESKKERSDLQQ